MRIRFVFEHAISTMDVAHSQHDPSHVFSTISADGGNAIWCTADNITFQELFEMSLLFKKISKATEIHSRNAPASVVTSTASKFEKQRSKSRQSLIITEKPRDG